MKQTASTMLEFINYRIELKDIVNNRAFLTASLSVNYGLIVFGDC